jgi:UDP-N-acetyl-D-mannosaminuronate dehydrogenase
MLERFKSNSGHVGVVGLGYVGLPLSIAFVEAGYRVTGLDIDAEKVALLNRDETYIRHIGADEFWNPRGTKPCVTRIFALRRISQIEIFIGFQARAKSGPMRTSKIRLVVENLCATINPSNKLSL